MKLLPAILLIISALAVGVALGWLLAALFHQGKRVDQILEDEIAKRN